MAKQIRVLQVIGLMNRGGAETMIMNLYHQIDRSKIQFDFVVHTNQKCEYDSEIEKMGGKIYHIQRFNGINIRAYRNEWEEFFDNHKEYKIIHGHIGGSAAIYLKIAKNHGCYTIAHCHSTKSPERSLKRQLFPLFAYPTRYIADFFLGCSEAAGIDTYGKKVTNSGRFAVLNNAIYSENFKYSEEIRIKIQKQFKIDGKFVLGHVGRFSPPKNHKWLIDIFREVNDINKNSVLLLVGDGELRQAMEVKVAKLGLSDNVIFTGVRTDISELMQAMDVFVFPSLNEGLGIVAIEAQAAGLHCVVADSIPKEAFITDLINSLPLNRPIDIWAKEILQYSNGYERRNNIEEIKTGGYDIRDTAKWLQEFYLNRLECEFNC